jgi:uncharacterized protein DUF3467
VSDQSADGDESNLQLVIPEEWEGGAYANFVSVWHSPHEFTLDFCATQRPELDPEDVEGAILIRCRVVARLKIPVTLMFSVLRAINREMTAYEDAFGVIKEPEEIEEDS